MDLKRRLNMISNNYQFCGINSTLLQSMVLYLLIIFFFDQKQIQGRPVQTSANPNFVGEYGKLFQGDIVLTPKTRTAINSTGLEHQLWPDRTLYYQFSDEFNNNEKTWIEWGCFPAISTSTCILFKEGMSSDGSYVEFVKTDPEVCSSAIGKQGGRQEINFPDQCFDTKGECIHQVMHALGFFHEQNRPDRDNYIFLHQENIGSNSRGQYEKITSPVDSFGSMYDYTSIMHYKRTAFAVADENGRQKLAFEPTKLKMNPGIRLDDIGQRVGLSYEDIYQIQRLYDCCGVAWNYNSTANGTITPFLRSAFKALNISESSISVERSARSIKKKSRVKIPVIFARSICNYYRENINTAEKHGKLESYLPDGPQHIGAFKNKNVIWSKCSPGDTSCHKFMLDETTKIDDDPLDDPGEFGNFYDGDLYDDIRGYPPVRDNYWPWLWPNREIFYAFDSNVETRHVITILEAMNEIQQKTCVTFRQASNKYRTPHVSISTSYEGCTSTFGYKGVEALFHPMNLNPAGCLSGGTGKAVHQLLHAVGLVHEHTKPFRDDWIIINRSNVAKSDYRKDFDIISLRDPWHIRGPVDYGSIMMVPPTFRAKQNTFTITPREDIGNIVMGQRDQMTPQDVAKVLNLYKCCSPNTFEPDGRIKLKM